LKVSEDGATYCVKLSAFFLDFIHRLDVLKNTDFRKLVLPQSSDAGGPGLRKIRLGGPTD
jgi:hypothetical protein